MAHSSYEEGSGEKLKDVAGGLFEDKISLPGKIVDGTGLSHHQTVHTIVHRNPKRNAIMTRRSFIRPSDADGASGNTQSNHTGKMYAGDRLKGQDLSPQKQGQTLKSKPAINNCSVETLRNERTPLLRQRRDDDLTDDSSDQLHIITTLPRGYGTRHTLRKKGSKATLVHNSWLSKMFQYIISTLATRHISVMVFLLLLVLGIVLSIAANLNLDKKGNQIEPKHVKWYLAFLILISVLWVMICVLPRRFACAVPHHSSLIPSHLLTGVAIFGSGNAIFHMLHLVDFLKCRQYNDKVNPVIGVYALCKASFIYSQIYLFYRLSRGGTRNCKVPGGNFFIMLTLATNMCIWWDVFLSDATNDSIMKDVSWVNHYSFGGNHGNDSCTNATATSSQVKQIHKMVASLHPLIVTFSMEYALLASGLLVHVWMSIKGSDLSQDEDGKKYWTIWRVGFIIGLLTLPSVVVAYIHESQVRNVGTAKIVLCALQGLICTVLLISSLYCMTMVKKHFVKTGKPMKLDVVLLGVSFVGFPILDICIFFSAVAESKNLPTSQVVWSMLSSFADFTATGLQFLFIKTAYEYKLPEVPNVETHTAAKIIRQFCSFAFVNNIAYWGAKTYELRSSAGPNVSGHFFGSYAWFGLSHLAYPLCIFFHFHLAICYANVVSFYSQFRVPLSRRTAS